jgi:glutamyl-tRNA reductase
MVDEALERWRRARAERTLAPVLAALQRHYQETARTGLERLFDRELAGLGPAEREAVARWAEALARRFAHLPAAGLRELAADHGEEALSAFFRRADDGLARALAAAGEPAQPTEEPA